MELSEEFILELTEVQSRLFGFLFKRLASFFSKGIPAG